MSENPGMKLKVIPQQIDLVELIDETLRMMRIKSNNKNIKLKY